MRRLIATLFLTALAVPLPCSAASYTFTDLGDGLRGIAINSRGDVAGYESLGPNSNGGFFSDNGTLWGIGSFGGANSYVSGINASVQVAGFADTSSNTTHAFLGDETHGIRDLGTLGGSGSSAFGINDNGQVVGSSNTKTGANHAFLYDGTMHDLGSLGGTSASSWATGINASGQVAGYSGTVGDLTTHAFLYDGTMHDLGTLGGNSYGEAINTNGQVAGWSYTTTANTTHHAFLYDGTMHDLGTLGGTTSQAYGVNGSGRVVGFSNTAFGGDRAFLYDTVHGMVDLNTLVKLPSGWTLNEALAINDLGQITGIGTSIDGQTHAFLLTPVPEPSSVALAALGLTGLAAWGWRRKSA